MIGFTWRDATRPPKRGSGDTGFSATAQILERRMLFAAFTVTTVSDDGPGSLRQAILNANAATGPDDVRFDLAGEGVQTIALRSALPAVTDAILDATTQPGYAGTPLVRLDGSAAGAEADGVKVLGSGVVRGLAVTGFGACGIVLSGAGRVTACYVGITRAGDAAAGNGSAGIRVAGGGASIGGTDAADRNVISGNGRQGVWVVGSASGGVTIRGNYIGTDVAGTRAIPNGSEGVLIDAGVPEAMVGGTATGAGNVISGNAASGVLVGRAARATLRGNRIGTDAGGDFAVPNGASPTQQYRDGVTTVGATLVLVGGPSVAERNVISGNFGSGVGINSGLAGEVRVRGNFIGTDASGNAAVGNAGDGVYATGIRAGAAGSVRGNVISGNGQNGVRMWGVSVGVFGNYIGTNAAGDAPLGNGGDGVVAEFASLSVGNAITGGEPAEAPPVIDPAGTTRNIISANRGHGIRGIHASPEVDPGLFHGIVVNNYVGTDVTGTRPMGNGGDGMLFEEVLPSIGFGFRIPVEGSGNLVSANGGNGITIVGVIAESQDSIQGNRIGTDATGAMAAGLGNRGNGIAVLNSTNVLIGSLESSSRKGVNTVAFNGGSGVVVQGFAPGSRSSPATASILRNSIYSNGRIGIDLVSPLDAGGSGVTLNDRDDRDAGPNDLRNFPEITAVSQTATGTRVSFVFNEQPGREVRVEFFASPVVDPSGYGEGREYLGALTFNVDSTGVGRATAGLPKVRPGTYITATATTTATRGGKTSEFSKAVRVGAPVVRSRVPYLPSPFMFRASAAMAGPRDEGLWGALLESGS